MPSSWPARAKPGYRCWPDEPGRVRQDRSRGAAEQAKGAVLASDGFFPFDDTVRLAASHGITAVIHPGGSMRDADSIKACDELGLAMVLTGRRHFLH